MLTEREILFAEAVSRGLDGTTAARAAGYSGSDKTVGAYASRLRRKPDVEAEIDRRASVLLADAELAAPLPPLDPKHAVFVAVYSKGGNGAKAAIAAGYKKSGAARVACELLARADVREALERERTKREVASIATTRELLARLTKIVRDTEAEDADVIKACAQLVRMLGVGAMGGGRAAEEPEQRVIVVCNGRGPEETKH